MEGLTLFAGVALLTIAAPFELTEPLVRLPRQSISSLESAVIVAFVGWGAAVAATRRAPEWRTPLTLPWIALLAAMAAASFASPVSRVNALHMTGRFAAALGVYLLAVNGITTRGRLRTVLALAVAIACVVSALALLEFAGVRRVLDWLTVFRPGVATVGAQVRAGGPLQYPTIASMYLEVVFAFGLGLTLAELDAHHPIRAAILVAALALIAEGIIVTFTRAGLISIVLTLVFVGAIRVARRGVDAGGRLVTAMGAMVLALVGVSHSGQSLWLRMTTEGQASWYRAEIAAPSQLALRTGENAIVPIEIANTGRLAWDSSTAPPVVVSYHWRPPLGDRFVVFEGARTPLASRVEPGGRARVNVRVHPPRQPGRYRIEWDLVQEGRLWFSTEPGAAHALTPVVVDGRAADAPPLETLPPPPQTVRPGRIALWRAAGRMIAAHPLLGVGPDNFRLSYGTYAGIASADPRTHSNNMYIELLAGGGLLAGAAFAWLTWRVAHAAAAALRASAGSAAAAGIVAAIVTIAAHATVDSFVGFAPTYVLFSLTLGCAVACARGVESPLANRV
jgi:O-antigen ligase